MPTYEYLCEKCGKEFEKFQSITAKPLTVCPREQRGLKSWGKGRVRKLIGAGAGLLFKGSGFYITDYRSDSYKQAAKKGTATPGTADTAAVKSAASGEAKPAAKPAGKKEKGSK